MFGTLEKKLRPVLFYGNNPLSLIGGALTSAAAFVMIGFWVVTIFGHGGSQNPYIGLIFDLFLPGLFVLGLILIPIGIGLRRKQLVASGHVPSVYPEIDLQNPVFRRGIEVVIAATFINFVIVGTASYRGVSYMDSPNFCGQTCHVMAPQWAAYQVSPHSHVACVDCHIGSGFSAAVHAKMNGTKQLVEVTFHTYPTPIRTSLSVLRPARATCEQCHTPTRFVGDRLLVKTSFGDDAGELDYAIGDRAAPGRSRFFVAPERHPRTSPESFRIHRDGCDGSEHYCGEGAQSGRHGDGICEQRLEGTGQGRNAGDGLHGLS